MTPVDTIKGADGDNGIAKGRQRLRKGVNLHKATQN